MTYRQAYKQYGNGESKKGKREIDALAAKVMKKYGIKVSIVPQINEEEPEDNWLNALFEYKVTNDGTIDQTKAFEDAFDEVAEEFCERGLILEYECSGDGDGIIESFRVC